MSSRILVIGGTGIMGQHLAKASLAAGHPTALLVRPANAADPSKLKLLEALKESGATIVNGDMNDHESLVAAIKQADVVISAVGHHGSEELPGIYIQRFVPSEYGMDVEQGLETVVEPARSILVGKVRVRQAVRAAGIPHTFICSYWPHGFLLPRLGNPEAPLVTATDDRNGARHHGGRWRRTVDATSGVEATELYPDVKLAGS
nr:unnamed protein product [Digitaria exilis]